MIFIDQLNIFSFLEVIKSRYKKVYVLSKLDNSSLILINLLKILKVKVVEETFFYGDLRSFKSESLFIHTRKSSVKLSFEYSNFILDNMSIINNTNSVIDNNIFKSYISKILMDEFEYFLRRIDYILNEYPNSNYQLIIKSPKLIGKNFLRKNSKIKLKFTGNNLHLLIKETFKFRTKILISLIRNLFISKRKLNYKTNLSIATDQIKTDCPERHFPHWLNSSTFKNQVIINNLNYKIGLSKEFIRKNNISILGKKDILHLPNKYLKIKFKNNLNPHLKICFNQLLYLSQGLICLLKKYNCDKFIFSEPQDPISDAIILSKTVVDIETFCIQYSNMCMPTPVMITCADNFLCFSKEHEKAFRWNNIGPKKFISTGYTFLTRYKNQDLIDLKENLYKKGVENIIAYFDESMQYDKWGYKSFKTCKLEYEIIADFILKNENYAIILKPKFVRNTISIFNSNKIDQALKTGRLIELKSGTHRNLITPQQVGSISEFSISDLVGGTAGLESGLAGSIVFFINPVNYISMLEDIYSQSGMLVDDTTSALNLILEADSKDDFSNSLINKLSLKDVSIEKILGS